MPLEPITKNNYNLRDSSLADRVDRLSSFHILVGSRKACHSGK